MTSWKSLILLPALLSGCIIYDTTDTCRGGKCDDGYWDDTGNGNGGNGGNGGTTTDTDTGEPVVEVAFSLDPGQAEAGTSLFATLNADQAFDFGTITSLRFYGDVEIVVWEARADQILMTLTVPADAVVGSSADLLIEIANGDVQLLEGALTIVAPGSGDDTGTTGGDDTGTTGSDDTGTTGGDDSGTTGGDDTGLVDPCE